ncbi:UDP-GalNAc:beta-1,3-N-acetylgalactosaminyltransferase 1 isoform X4 [Equus asinus]|uniref:UDP-GalNAc:beta-1, 3-N-acetylgalactosaminyltransferase 1 isoform X4 n=1 Tax=Equus asinus TaxID=9793 RepID=UPI0038F7A917
MRILISKSLQDCLEAVHLRSLGTRQAGKEERVLNINPCHKSATSRLSSASLQRKRHTYSHGLGRRSDGEHRESAPGRGRGLRAVRARACVPASEPASAGLGAARGCARPAVRAAAGRLRVRAGPEHRPPGRVGAACAPRSGGMRLRSGTCRIVSQSERPCSSVEIPGII